jgi:hypothetical protein
MKKSKHILTIVALCGAALSQAGAAVVFEDTFASGTGSWYRASTLDTLSNTSGELTVARNTSSPTASDGVIGRSFGSQTLEVGETIRLTLDYSQDVASNVIFRAGLYDFGTTVGADNWSNGNIGAFSGYYTFIRDASNTSNLTRYDSAASSTTAAPPTSAGASMTTSGSFKNFDINQDGTVTYQVLFEITRTSSTQIDTLFMLSSGGNDHFEITGSTTTNLFTTFDSVVLRVGGGTATYDNIKLEVIPEPSAALLGGLGLLALLRRRR